MSRAPVINKLARSHIHLAGGRPNVAGGLRVRLARLGWQARARA